MKSEIFCCLTKSITFLLFAVSFFTVSELQAQNCPKLTDTSACVPPYSDSGVSICIDRLRNMNFGKFAIGSSGGTIQSNGNVTGDVVLLDENNVNGRFRATGCPNTVINVTISPSDFQDSSSNEIPFDIANSVTVLTLNNNGRKNRGLRGRLTVSPGTPAGFYSGTVTVTVDY